MDRPFPDIANLNRATLIQLVDKMPIGALFIEEDTIIFNQAVERLTGYGRIEITTLDEWFRKVHGTYHSRIRELYEADRAAGFPTPREVPIIRKDGDIRYVEFAVAGSAQQFCIMTDVTARKQTEETLQDAVEQLSILLGSLPVAVYKCRATGDFAATFITRNIEALSGYSPREFLATPGFWMERIHPDDAERVLAGLPKIFATGSHEHQYRWRHADGSYRWFNDFLRVVRDESGKPLHLVGIFQDITERRVAEEALLDSLRTSEEIVQAIPAGLYIYQFTPPDRLLLVSGNPEAERLTGIRAEDWQGREFNEIWPEAHKTGITESYLEVMHTGKLYETEELYYQDDRLSGAFRVRAFVLTGNRLAVSFENITERRVAEQALRDNEKLLREAQRVGKLGVYNLNIVGNHWQSSPELDAIFGIDTDYLRTTSSWLALVHPDHRARMERYFLSLLAEPTWFDMEYPIVRPSDGKERWLYGTGEFTLNADGKPVRMIGTIQDITERKRAEQAIKQLNDELDQRVQQRTAQLQASIREQEAFSYSVSHDLRGPLRHINSYSALLAEDFGGSLPPQAHGYLERIRAASSRMGNLIDNLLELSRVSRVEMKTLTVNLSELARGIAAALQESEPQRQVEWVIADNLTGRGDPTLLRQLGENLLGNAWKYTARTTAARIEFGQADREGECVFFVRDNGAGFDMAYQDKLFGPFQRLHGDEFEGTGIGLATVQRIIERHGGRIWAEGKVNEGATFYYTLGP